MIFLTFVEIVPRGSFEKYDAVPEEYVPLVGLVVFELLPVVLLFPVIELLELLFPTLLRQQEPLLGGQLLHRGHLGNQFGVVHGGCGWVFGLVSLNSCKT